MTAVLNRMADRNDALNTIATEQDPYIIDELVHPKPPLPIATNFPSPSLPPPREVPSVFIIAYEIERPEIKAHDLVIYRPPEMSIKVTKSGRRELTVEADFIFEPASIAAVSVSLQQQNNWIDHHLPHKVCSRTFLIPFEIDVWTPALHGASRFVLIRVTPPKEDRSYNL